MKTKRIVSVILAVFVLLNVVTFSVGAKNSEITQTGNNVVEITSYEQLRNCAQNAQQNVRYVLANDIEQDDNKNDMEIVVGSLSEFTLDLNGYSINRSTKGNDNTLFRIKNGGYMKIMDSSQSQTGYCSFSEGYSSYYKSVFLNEGGELEIVNGYYEIFSPFEQGDCCILRTTSGYTNIYGGTFDSSSAFGGDTISVGHDAYLYNTPCVKVFDGDFYGKYQNIDVSPYGNFLAYGKEYPQGSLHPFVFVLGGKFFVCNGGENGEWASFAYCNNGWGRVIVASGTMLAKCLNASDQRFLNAVKKTAFTETIDNYTGTYYEVSAPPVIMADGVDYHNRLINLCYKQMVSSYPESVYKIFKEPFDIVLENIDTVYVDESEKTSPYIKLENRRKGHQYIRWYMCDESSYCGESTQWTRLSDYDDVSQWQPKERPEDAKSYIIRCVVTNSDLSTYEDMLRITYEPLKTEKVVASVEINDITVPTLGATPDMSAFCYTEGCNVDTVEWYDVTGSKSVKLSADSKFEAGRTYRVVVGVATEGNCSFYMEDGYNETTGTINGETAKAFGSHDDKFLEFYYDFTVREVPDTGLRGDVDLDSKVTVLDATTIQLYKALILELNDIQLKCADVDNDNKVTVMDASKIQMYKAEIIPSL